MKQYGLIYKHKTSGSIDHIEISTAPIISAAIHANAEYETTAIEFETEENDEGKSEYIPARRFLGNVELDNDGEPKFKNTAPAAIRDKVKKFKKRKKRERVINGGSTG